LKKFLLSVVVLAAVAALALYWTVRPAAPPERQVFINGTVLTMGPNNRVATAVAIEGNRIVAVGTEADVAPYRDNAVVHDLGGRTLVPGFIDAHGHFPGSGLTEVSANLNSPPIGQVQNIAQLQSQLRSWVERKAPGEWITGTGYDDTLLAEKRHPSREELDAVSSDHPIAITHVSGHMIVANSAALAMAGIDENTANPDGGVIVKDPVTGVLTGLLEETAAEPVQTLSMDFSLTDIVAMFRSAVELYVSMGVTTAQSGGVNPQILTGLKLASGIGYIPFRLELWPFWQMMGPEVVSGEFDLEPYNTDMMRTRVIKIVADGSIQGFTGYLGAPYHQPFRGDDSYRGYPIFEREELARIVTEVHQAGYQMAIHGNGDGAIDDIIYAFDKAQQAHPVDDPRLILIHAQMTREDQLDEFKRLGITPSFFSAHTYYWGDRHRDIFMGPERAMRMSPTRSALDKDLRFSVHLDTPIVPMDPLQMVWSTANRISTGGKVIGEAQRVSVMQALRAVTIDAAWQIFQENDRGSIEVGKLADLVVLSGNPVEHPQDMRELKVEQTLVGGVTIYSR
jgi:predicted amidohydrolase YtcJ